MTLSLTKGIGPWHYLNLCEENRAMEILHNVSLHTEEIVPRARYCPWQYKVIKADITRRKRKYFLFIQEAVL